MTDEGMTDIHVGPIFGDRIAVGWNYGGHRFHFWADRYTLELKDNKLYKNSIAAYGEEGWFRTRELKINAADNQRFVNTALKAVREGDMVNKFTAAEIALKFAEETRMAHAQAEATRTALEKYLPADLVRALPQEALLDIYAGIQSHRYEEKK